MNRGLISGTSAQIEPRQRGRWLLALSLTCLGWMIFIVFPASCSGQDSADWPQWRGPERNGISQEKGWFANWPKDGSPKIAWRAQAGKGHSAVSVADGRAFTLGWDGAEDTVFCFDAATGELIWKKSYPCRDIKQWPGPRSTPTVHNGTVYTLGQHGQLRAWDAKSGGLRWQRDLPEDYNPDVDYGFTSSPLIEGDLLILNAGSHGLAFRTKDGSIAWGDDRQKAACVSPVPFRLENRRGVLIVSLNADRSAANLVGIDPRTGEEFWRFDGWKEQWGALGVDPLVHEGKVFITSAEQYRHAARFTIAGKTLREDWSTNRVAGYTGAAVLLGGHLYLVDGNGILKCVNWNTGEVAWNQRGFGERGTLIASDGKLILQTGESGELIIAEADPAGYRELRRVRVFAENGHTFTAPVLARGRIYCRSYAGEVVCLELSP